MHPVSFFHSNFLFTFSSLYDSSFVKIYCVLLLLSTMLFLFPSQKTFYVFVFSLFSIFKLCCRPFWHQGIYPNTRHIKRCKRNKNLNAQSFESALKLKSYKFIYCFTSDRSSRKSGWQKEERNKETSGIDWPNKDLFIWNVYELHIIMKYCI